MDSIKIHPDSIALQAYNEMAKYYEQYVDTKPWNAYYERPATLSLLPDVKDKHVLDAGCAGGWYTKWLLDQGAHVCAVDFNKNMVEAAKRRTGNRGCIIQADLNMPLDFIQDGSIDIIVASLVLHYIKNISKVFGEFYRILKTGGVLVFSVHHPFMDFLNFCRDNYLALELLEDEWTMGDEKIAVQFYRRPLHAIVQPMIDHRFTIEKILEPIPTQEFKEAMPEVYTRLTKRPQFLCIRGEKK
jgi:SAM-dependent methyltransferase